MNEFEDLTSRLKALGDSPVPPPVATQHLTEMASVSKSNGGGLARKIRVAAAFGVGILVGGTGLGYAAAQDALPAPAQNAVEAAGKAVGLEIAAEKKAANAAAKAERQAAKGEKSGGVTRNSAACPGGQPFRNHGQYMKSVAQADYADEAAKQAAMEAASKSLCGKPIQADGTADADDADDANKGAGKANGKANKPAKADKPEDDGDDAAENEAVEPEQKPATPAGPPAEQPGNAPAQTPPADVPVSDNADDTAGEHTPEDVPPVDPGAPTGD